MGGGKWEVVGGSATGGILVREGKETNSSQCYPRLSTGTIVEELDLVDGRLHFKVISGTGPATGWVSTKLKDQDLVAKTEKTAEDAFGKVGQSWGDNFDFDDLPELVKTKLPMAQETINSPEVYALMKDRCDKEATRPALQWNWITVDTVVNNHMNVRPGIAYGIDFPWNEAMLVEMGPDWLTKAFHTVGSMPQDNKVTKIIPEETIKVTTGNNGGKFLFQVEYEKPDPNLHTKLFAKVPFPLDGKTRQDRLSSSVNKQPMELFEMNASRLLEATLPMKTPHFYFGDISNETSNWILITSCIQFEDFSSQNYGPPKPRLPSLPAYQIEGPYDKCIDHNLRGDPLEYYMLLVKVGARMAALAKVGEMGSAEVLASSFAPPPNASDPMAMGGNPYGCTGENPKQVGMKLKNALTFFSTTAAAVYHPYAGEDNFQKKFTETMMKANSYAAELNYWMSRNSDYVALAHGNMNVDNAYFWRDDKGTLECGVFDWGGVGAGPLGMKLWWWLYCMDHAVFKESIKQLVTCFIDTYQEYGAPRLDAKQLLDMILTAGIQQMFGLVSAVPQIVKMCPKKEWETIKDRYDPRIGTNIDDKSTVRLYIHCQNSIMSIIHTMDGDKLVDRFIKNVIQGDLKWEPKTDEMMGL